MRLAASRNNKERLLSIQKVSLVSAIVAVGLGLLYVFFAGGTTKVSDQQLQEVVYVDLKTGEAYLIYARSSPAVHPVSGEPTLVPGMYCDKCKAWKPVGSMEQLQTSRTVHKCPVHKIRLLREGPIPEST